MMADNAAAFVGRGRELASLRELAALVTSGQEAAAALVVAEPGLGKSRLLTEAALALPLRSVRAHGYESARDIGFAAAGRLLRELAHAPIGGPRLEALLVGGPGVEAGLELVRLFEVAFRCLAELPALAIVVDDLQWVDAETLALLHYLGAAAEADGLPLLFLCASRPAAVVEPFAARMGGSFPPGRFVRIDLGPLPLDDGVDLAVTLAPRLGRDAAEELWRKAQGSPFWLAALATETGAGPDAVALIRRRYASLSGDPARVFALLLVAAEPLTLTSVCEILRWRQERARRACVDLVNRALGLQAGGEIRIAHDLIREAAARDLPPTETRSLHRLLASWLEASAGEDVGQLLRALEHHLASGQPVIALALRVVRSPQRRLLGMEGLSTLADIADAAVGGDGDALRREVARLAFELGDWPTALERWAALVERPGDGAERAEAALWAASAAFRLGAWRDVHRFAERARESAREEPLVAIEADCREVQALLWLEGRPSEAQPLVDRAVVAAQRLIEGAGGVERLTDAECGAYVRAIRGKLDAAIRRTDAATVARCAELIQRGARDEAETLAAASDAVFSMLQFEGLPGPAEPHARQALADSRRLALPGYEVEALHWTGWIAHQRARLDEASDLMHEAVALADRVGPPRRFTMAQLRAVMHGVDASRGDWRNSVTAIEQAIAAETDAHFRMVIRTIHMWVIGRFAPIDAARLEALLDAMELDAAAAGCGRCHWEAVLHGSEAEARSGDLSVAETALEQWDAAQPRPRPGPAARRAYVAALVAARRDPEASLPLFAHAAKLAESVGHDLMRLWIELDRATVLAAVDHALGVAALRAVAADAEAKGALSERQLAVSRLRQIGVRAWRRGRRADAGTLTRREHEIARLIALGDSNPEIAAALFLSRRTVERHVSNALAKVGARNRAELAALLAQKR